MQHDTDTTEERQSRAAIVTRALWWLANALRYTFSVTLFLASISIVLVGIVYQKTNFYSSVPIWVDILLLFLFVFLLGVLEGGQVAVMELMKVPGESYGREFPRAHGTMSHLSKGRNLERYILGRQVLVVLVVFVLTRLTTLSYAAVFGEAFNAFLQSGLLGAVMVVVLGQLAPQVIATRYDVYFVNALGMDIVIRTCLFVEFCGVTHACWVLANMIIKAFRLKRLESNTAVTVAFDAADTEATTGNSDSRMELLETGNSSLVTSNSSSILSIPKPEAIDDPNSLPVLVGSRVYASSESIVDMLRSKQCPIPKYLLSPSSADYVPPHIAAMTLLVENIMLKEKILGHYLYGDVRNVNEEVKVYNPPLLESIYLQAALRPPQGERSANPSPSPNGKKKKRKRKYPNLDTSASSLEKANGDDEV